MAIKYKLLANLLREELMHNGERYKLPTEAELCQKYGMSRQTVRNALKLLAEEGLVEKRHGSGTYSTGKNIGVPRQIAVAAAFPDEYITPYILHEARSALSNSGYFVRTYATKNQISVERDILQQILDEPVSGLLVEGVKTALPNPNATLYEKLKIAQIPIVFFHGICPELNGTPCISGDDYGGGYCLAGHLIEGGRRRIAGIFQSDDIRGLRRYSGVISAIRDVGLPIIDPYFSWYDTQTHRDILARNDSGFLQNIIKNRLKGADSVVCQNDELAFMLIRELLQIGMKIPDDIAVVSFDNSFYTQLSPVGITSLRHKNSKLGQTAAATLIQLMQNGRANSKKLVWELVKRASG